MLPKEYPVFDCQAKEDEDAKGGFMWELREEKELSWGGDGMLLIEGFSGLLLFP